MDKEQKTIFEQNIERGVKKGLLSFSNDEKKITYIRQGKSYRISDPEEKVRASYYTELVLDYGYDANELDLEVKVPRRTPNDRADIVIYEDEEKKAPLIVVECKKDGISDAEFTQAIEQAFGNANSLRSKFAIVVAGNTKSAFDVAGFKPSEREKNVIADIPKKDKPVPKYKFVKKQNDLEIVSREELIKALEKAHDTIWQGGKLAPTAAFDEVTKLLFCKIADEKNTPNGKEYRFQVGTHEKPEDVFKRIDQIYQEAKKLDSEVFKEDIKLGSHVVYTVVEHLQSINFHETDLDTKGVAFERFMEDFFKGKMGQFFTPREVIRFCVEMMDIKDSDKILDTSCGSGGFLLACLDYIRRWAEANFDEKQAWQKWHTFAQNNLYGIEINEQIARVCKMNMIVHDDGHTNIIASDALVSFEQLQLINQKFEKGSFDKILTNPPFGAKVKGTEKKYLKHYKLGEGKKNQKTEVLFIERCLDFLKDGTGTMAIVLPDGILTNSSLQYVRDFLMERTEILAVVSLPQFAFSHFGAGVKSSLVFVRKLNKGERKENYPIFMAMAERIGYDATGRGDKVNHFLAIAEEYKKFKADKLAYNGLKK